MQRDDDNNNKCRRYNKRKQRRIYALGRGRNGRIRQRGARGTAEF
jgi:hypothetical protein